MVCYVSNLKMTKGRSKIKTLSRIALFISVLMIPHILAASEYKLSPEPFEGVWSQNTDCSEFLWKFKNGKIQIENLMGVSKSFAKYMLKGRVFHVFRENSFSNPNVTDTVTRMEVLGGNLLRIIDITNFKKSVKMGAAYQSNAFLYKCKRGFLNFGWTRDD